MLDATGKSAACVNITRRKTIYVRKTARKANSALWRSSRLSSLADAGRYAMTGFQRLEAGITGEQAGITHFGEKVASRVVCVEFRKQA
jgi:hypothetical protein